MNKHINKNHIVVTYLAVLLGSMLDYSIFDIVM